MPEQGKGQPDLSNMSPDELSPFLVNSVRLSVGMTGFQSEEYFKRLIEKPHLGFYAQAVLDEAVLAGETSLESSQLEALRLELEVEAKRWIPAPIADWISYGAGVNLAQAASRYVALGGDRLGDRPWDRKDTKLALAELPSFMGRLIGHQLSNMVRNPLSTQSYATEAANRAVDYRLYTGRNDDLGDQGEIILLQLDVTINNALRREDYEKAAHLTAQKQLLTMSDEEFARLKTIFRDKYASQTYLQRQKVSFSGPLSTRVIGPGTKLPGSPSSRKRL